VYISSVYHVEKKTKKLNKKKQTKNKNELEITLKQLDASDNTGQHVSFHSILIRGVACTAPLADTTSHVSYVQVSQN